MAASGVFEAVPLGSSGVRYEYGQWPLGSRALIPRQETRMDNDRDGLADRLRAWPKAELHVHIEGTLSPELMVEGARRNDVTIPFVSVDEIRAAHQFADLQSFLDLYYAGASVLQTEADFYDLMRAYLDGARREGVVRAEVFFDPQTHLLRGVGFETFMTGFLAAIDDQPASEEVSTGLIMCFLRDRPAEEAMQVWHQAEPYWDAIIGVGLDSAEVGNPPGPFAPIFTAAADAGMHRVAHAGEEGPAAYIWEALDVLGVERIDHGVRAVDDPELVERLARDGIPLTMCPLSNLRLCVVDDLRDHNLKLLLDAGVRVTVNSDDPAYFGGTLLDNYLAIAAALDLSADEVEKLCRNSLEAAFELPAGR